MQAVGGQTNRPVDDVGLITDNDGWVTVQAKKGLRIAEAESSPLAEALHQLVDIQLTGVPDSPPRVESLREIDTERDLVLVLTDESAPQTVDRYLAPVTDRLRDLPDGVPLSDVPKNGDEKRALRVVRDHLAHSWRSARGEELTEAGFRHLAKVLSVRRMFLTDGGEHERGAQVMLSNLTDDLATARRVWRELQLEGQRLAEERSFIDRKTLIRRLEVQGINLRPAARLRSDISRLRDLTQTNIQALGAALTIAAPEGPVALHRTVEPAAAEADGNLAITGAPGTGKTVLLHTMAAELSTKNVDLVVLQSANLGASVGQTRIELGIDHDLSDVLLRWSGNRAGVLLIDGLDQTRAMDASGWLPDLARALSGTRWRIVATIRTFDLKHGRRWREMFAGDVVAPGAADAELAGVRHLVVGDLTSDEMAPLREASPRLARLLDDADAQLRLLLANPFNLDLAARLLTDSDSDLLTARSRVDLLDRYWRLRVLQGTGDLDRLRTLRAVVRQMLADRRQAVNPVDLPPQATSSALEGLRHDDVLRDLRMTAGSAMALITFAHPVLFDYAVAVLALGDIRRADSLAVVLDDDPNLAVTVRPSLEYRLAIAWGNDTSRRGFWHLALRLASRTSGHLLAATVAAQVAAREMEDFADIEVLANACTGIVSDPNGNWGTAEAGNLAFLVAAAIARHPRPQHGLEILADLTSHLAATARATDSVDLALLAAQLPLRAVNQQTTALHAASPKWISTAVDCMKVALEDLTDPSRVPLGQLGSRLLAAVASRDPDAVGDVISAIIAPQTIQAWSIKAVEPLISQIPDLAKTAPQFAVAIGAAVWEYKETEETATTQLIDSAILGMTSNRRQDLESAQFAVGQKFAELVNADLSAAADLLMRIVELPRMYSWGGGNLSSGLPQLRMGNTLELAGGGGSLPTMVDAFIARFGQVADLEAESAQNPERGQADEIVAKLLNGLHLSEVWQKLLYHAAMAPSPALSRALLPALTSPSLYVQPDTWNAASHVAARLSPSLEQDAHLRLEYAILGLVEAGASDTDPAKVRDQLRLRARMILNALDADKLSPEARQLVTGQPDLAEPLPDLTEDYDSGFREIGPWSPDRPIPGSMQDLASQIHAASQQSRDQNPQNRAEGLRRLTELWDELKGYGAGESATQGADDQRASLRAEIAERLATSADVTPDTELGSAVYSALLSALPDATSASDNTGPDWDSTPTPSWRPTPGTNAIQGLVHLAWRQDWMSVHEQIAASLGPLLDSTNRVHRYLASYALPALHRSAGDLLSELERRLQSDEDRHIATHLMNLLAQLSGSEPERVDQVLQRLASLPRWAVLTSSPSGDRPLGPADQAGVAVGLMAQLAAGHGSPYSHEAVSAWLAQPVDNPNRAAWTIGNLRGLLNPADAAARPAQDRAFGLISLSMNQLRDVFAEAQQPGATQAPSQRITDAIKIAADIAQHLYFASGAFGQTDPSPPGENQSRFTARALPLLDQLSHIHFPAVTQQIVQITDHISGTQPKRALLTAAAAVIGDPAYAREPLGLDTTLQLVRHFTAEHRDLVLNDPECTTAVRALLEAFVRLGWDQAIDLAEQLDELFT